MGQLCDEEAAFHFAIEAAPTDRLPLLVFADWLADRGDPRSEGYRALAELGARPERLFRA